MTGKIIKQISNLYTVLTEKGELLEVRAKGKLRHMTVDGSSSFYKSISAKTKKDIKTMKIEPKVGDNVILNTSEDVILIDEILPRKNDLYRPDVCNVDQILLVFSATEPAFNEALLDKFLVLLEHHLVKTYIIITKTDLLDTTSLHTLTQTLDYYANIGYPYLMVNPKTKEGLKEIKALLKNKVTVVTGQTGVGKSTLLNRLIPNLDLQTQEISQALGRGKHTTRHTELFALEGGLIADTPGFSKLSFAGVKEEDLKFLFLEFQQYTCKFNTCNHLKEPQCGVKEAVELKTIMPTRYTHYVQFYEDIKTEKKTY